jgi:hypothetical protein
MMNMVVFRMQTICWPYMCAAHNDIELESMHGLSCQYLGGEVGGATGGAQELRQATTRPGCRP